MIERLIARLDAMDGDPDMEPDHDGEAEPDEASLQPLTMARDARPAAVHTRARRAA
ncbi:hypothetical protein [Teichococcus wenyumeiae]|nr:hypothetical protein [Pseudoroseomonas wenyumeiae]